MIKYVTRIQLCGKLNESLNTILKFIRKTGLCKNLKHWKRKIFQLKTLHKAIYMTYIAAENYCAYYNITNALPHCQK